MLSKLVKLFLFLVYVYWDHRNQQEFNLLYDFSMFIGISFLIWNLPEDEIPEGFHVHIAICCLITLLLQYLTDYYFPTNKKTLWELGNRNNKKFLCVAHSLAVYRDGCLIEYMPLFFSHIFDFCTVTLQYSYSMIIDWGTVILFSCFLFQLIAILIGFFWSKQPVQPDSEDEAVVDDVGVDSGENQENQELENSENLEDVGTQEPPQEKGIRIPECRICLIPYSSSAYSTPRALQCGHSICTNCAVTLLEESNYLNIECPFCRKFTKEKKIESIKRNYAVMEIVEKLSRGIRFNPKCFRCHSGYNNLLTECTPRVQMECGHTLCEICIRTRSTRLLRCPECFLTGLGGQVTVWQSAKRLVCRMFGKNRNEQICEKEFPKNFVILEMLESFPCDSTCDSTHDSTDYCTD
ncbi:hypothetical protein CRE_22950 [Caenorhabditis remanei]|uniref:RING-type domain-containing protein n=1 Tax=Caenorhabditis remanei TaxID=31234 RepID=E3MVZ7_CAERE|nr:hypothetical protein CRE_22950 [Caenorhabditis remanei]